jgi:hypothetical protein
MVFGDVGGSNKGSWEVIENQENQGEAEEAKGPESETLMTKEEKSENV